MRRCASRARPRVSSRGSAWKTCTWSGQTCSSQSPPAARDVGGERVERRRRASRAPPAWIRVGGMRASARDVEGEPGMADIGSRAVQPDEPLRRRGADRRVAAQLLARARKPEGEVDQRREQHHGRRVRDVGLQQQVDGEVPARRIAGDDDPSRVRSPSRCTSQSQPGQHVDGGGGEAVTRGEAVVDDRTPAARSAGTARPSACGGCAASTARIRCRARSRWHCVACSVTPAPRTHSPTTRRPSGRRTSTFSTWCPPADGPKVSMIAGDDLARRPQAPGPLGRQHRADLSQGHSR